MNFKKNYLLSILCALFLALPSKAQQNETGNWLMYFGQYKLQDKLSLHGEIQYRSRTVSPDLQQLLIRTGVNYHFQSNAFATAGYGYISTEINDSTTTQEHRIWQQFISTQKFAKVKVEHRYRVEQRFIDETYRNRLRYRVMTFVPINGELGQKGNFFIGAYDEIFINPDSDFFDRNRAYLALGYQVSSGSNIQIGILNQRVSDFGKWNLQIGFVNNLDLR